MTEPARRWRELVRRRTGLSPSGSVTEFLDRRANIVAGGDPDQYRRQLAAEPLSSPEWRELIAVVTNGHTAFLRDRAQLELALKTVATLTGGRRPGRVWSCGCATGEEAYSLAMLAALRGQAVEVTGTDINREAIEAARAGAYRAWSLRRTPPTLRDRFFRHEGDVFRPVEELVAAVRFHHDNVVAESTSRPRTPVSEGNWDAIICRNVFIYFDAEAKRRALVRFAMALSGQGIVSLAPGDLLAAEAEGVIPASLRGRLQGRMKASSTSSIALGTRAGRPSGAGWSGGAAAGRKPTRPSEAGPAPVLVALWRGNRALAGHDFETALAAYDEAHAHEPLDAEVHYLRAVALRRSGALEEAAESCRRALFLDPSLWPARFLSAGLAERLGAVERGREDYERTRALLRDAPEARPLKSFQAGWEDLFPGRDEAARACHFHLARTAGARPRR
ncbi:MAG: CheR family methyltransferase [Myxococcota bacterium]